MRAVEKVGVREHRTVAVRAVELGWKRVDYRLLGKLKDVTTVDAVIRRKRRIK